LYPGATAVLVSLAGLAPAVRAAALPFLAGVAFSVEGTRGERGVLFPALQAMIPPLRGLRAPARFAVLVQLSLGVLAALGLTAIVRAVDHRAGRRVAVAIAGLATVLCLAEYATRPLTVRRVVSRAPPVYGWLAGQPRGVVLELPLPLPWEMWLHETSYQYMSTFHWFPLVNGYSGYAPRSYLATVEGMRGFPDALGQRTLAGLDVTYVLVHEGAYSRSEVAELRTVLDAHPAFSMLVRLPDAAGAMTVVYRLDRAVLAATAGR
jgi:hypothetical protein